MIDVAALLLDKPLAGPSGRGRVGSWSRGLRLAALLGLSCSSKARPPVPRLTSVEAMRGAGQESVRVHGQAPPGTMIELFLSPDCRGIPRAAAPSRLLSAGLELPVPRTGGTVKIYALARDPERGASACSEGLVISLPATRTAAAPPAPRPPAAPPPAPPPPASASWQELGLESPGAEGALWQRVLAAQDLLEQNIQRPDWEQLSHEVPGFVPVGTLSLSLGKDPRFLTPDLNGDGAPDYAVLGVSRATALGAAISAHETPAEPGKLLLELRRLRTLGGGQLLIGLSGAQGRKWLAQPGGSGLLLVRRWAEKPPGCDPLLGSKADVAWARAHRCDGLELDGSETEPVRYLLWNQRAQQLLSLEDQCEERR